MTLLASGGSEQAAWLTEFPQPLLTGCCPRTARLSFRHVPLYSGCDSAWQRAGKCRAGRGGLICHADQTSGRFAVGQEPSRSSGTKLGGGMAFHFFTRSRPGVDSGRVGRGRLTPPKRNDDR
jgi:hypothetical protein